MKLIVKKNYIFAYNNITKLLTEDISSKKNNNKEYVEIKNRFIKKLAYYLKFLQQIEEHIINKIDKREISQKIFNKMSDQIILSGYLLEKELKSNSKKKVIKKLFRECISSWSYQSQIARRGFEKPQGYSGDYKTIEMFYDQNPISKGIGYYFDKYILDNKLAYADIHRKDKIIQLLRDFIEKSRHNEEIRIINFGCGGCKEIRDLFSSFVPNKRINFLAVDQDTEAIQFSKGFINVLPEKVKLDFLQKNIINLIKSTRHTNPKEPFVNNHLVYSIGLVDYFADNTLQLFVRFCLKSLAHKGQLIFAHKNSKKWKSFITPDWLCDWRFYQRDIDRVLNIIKEEITKCSVKIKWEKTRHMFFLIIIKNYT